MASSLHSKAASSTVTLSAKSRTPHLKVLGFQPNQGAGNPTRNKVLKGPCVVPLEAKKSAVQPVPVGPANRRADLTEYMTHAAEHFANIELPLGGKLTRVDAQTMALVVPRFEILDIWLQPQAQTRVAVYADRAEISSQTGDCVLNGSHHVESLKLNDRFNLDVKIVFTWDNASAARPQIYADSRLWVEVDIPAPFSFMPKGVLKAAGDAAMSMVLSVMMPTFMAKLAADYTRWAETRPSA